MLKSGEIASKGCSTGIVYFDHAENDDKLSPAEKVKKVPRIDIYCPADF